METPRRQNQGGGRGAERRGSRGHEFPSTGTTVCVTDGQEINMRVVMI